MEDKNKDRKFLYDALTNKGINLGSYDEYNRNIDDPDKAKWLYDTLSGQGINLGSYEEYMSHIGHANVADGGVNAGGAGIIGSAGRGNVLTGDTSRLVGSVNPVTGQVYGGGNIATQRGETPVSAGNIDLDREKREDEEKALRAERRKYFEETGQLQRVEQIRDEAQKRLDENPNRLSWADRALGLTNIYHGTLNAWKDFKGLFLDEDMAADKRTVKNAEKIMDSIDEAGHSDNGWLDRQVGGTLRGVADSATDTDTWDFGLGGVSEGLAVKRVIEKQQRGENLSASEQGLMTMLGLKTYVDNSYGGDLSMGYRVGQSLPESAGFMVQMYLNPLSGLGKKTGEYFGKAAIKHFARQGMKEGLEKGLITGTKIVGRVGGDIVEQLGTTLIPGAGRVMEDALNRDNGDAGFYLDANGDVQYDGHFGGEMTGDGSYLDGEEPETERGMLGVSWRSFGKALGSNFIENWSEAVGEYFDPTGKAIGSVAKKGVEKLNSQKLNKLYDWVMNTKSSDFMTAMDKFKKRTKYDGLIGEYMEEVVGNMTNAATVGDNNFSMDPDSEDWQNSVFNPEMNAETFLSCALMSGTMRAVEGGVNYGQRRFLNGRVSKWEDRAAELLGDDWGSVKRRVDNSEPGELAEWLNDLRRQAGEVTDEKRKQGIYEQIKAVHNYAFYRSELQAFNARRVKDEEEMTPEQKAAEREEELRGQAEDVSESRVGLNEARSELDGVNSQLRETLEGMLDSGSTDGEINNVVGTLGATEKPLARRFVNAWKEAKRAEDNSVEIQQRKKDEAYEAERVQRRSDYRAYKLAMYQTAAVLGQEGANNLTMAKDEQEVEALIAHLRPDEQRAARALWQGARRVNAMFGEMEQSLNHVEESARQTAEREFTSKGHENGEMIQVMVNGSDEPVYVTSGELAFGQDEDGNTVVLPSQSDDMIIYADKNGDMKQATPSDIMQFMGRQTREEFVSGAVERAKSEAMGRFEAELESPELPAPAVGGVVTNPDNGRRYVIKSRENGVMEAVMLTEDGAQIDTANPAGMRLTDADYYDLKAREVWGDPSLPPLNEDPSLPPLKGGDSVAAGSSDAAGGSLPTLEDGSTDFDALFDMSAGRFYEEYAKEFGTEEANAAVIGKRDAYYKEAEKVRKQAEKSVSLNERGRLIRQAKELDKRGDEIGRLIGKSKNKGKDPSLPPLKGGDSASSAGSSSAVKNNGAGDAGVSNGNRTFAAGGEAAGVPSGGAGTTGAPSAVGASSAASSAGGSAVSGAASLKGRRKGRFLEQDAKLEPASTAREMAARAIATGALTLKWGDDKGSRGLGAHTFKSEGERRKRLWAFDNTEGLTPEMAAHALWQDMPEGMQRRYTDQDVFNEIVDLMTSYDSPTAMWQAEVLPNHAAEMGEEGAPGYAENEERMRMEWEAEQNGLSVEDWQSYNEYVAEQMASLPSQEDIDNEITLNLNNYGDRGIETEVPAVDAGQVAQAAGVELGAGERSNQPGAALERERTGAQGGILEGDAMVRQGDAETGGTGVRTAERGGQGDLENPSGRQQGTMETESINVTLSDEKDNNGIQFVLSKDGEEDFGFINDAQAKGISTNVAAPIRLSYGNEGYGYVYMQKHVDQLKENGYDSVEDFVKDVASGKNEIRQGNVYFNESTGEAKETYLLVKKGKKGSVLYVELVPNGEYYTVNSGGVFKNSYIEKRKELWSASTEHSAASGEPQDFPLTQQNPESGNVSALSQSTSSAGKVSAFVGEKQENNQEKRSMSAENANVVQEVLAAAEAATEANPTDAQKEAGNYKKGHVKIDGYDVTIENPKGSVRRGTDASGKQWEQEMQNTYGYIRGTEGVDGDHIDVFFSEDPSQGDVFVVDQVNKDGSFDEHKVMYGFASEEEARKAYLSNYEEGWQGLGAITHVSKEEFKKWIDSSVRKTKPFSEYKNVETGSSTSLIDVVRTLYTSGKEIASKIYQRSYFDVADTPAFMKNLGLRGNKFTIKYGVISRHIGKDSSHNLTESDWEQIPNALQNPFAISKLTDKDDSFRIYTTLKTSNGGYAVVGADVKNAGRNIEVNAISTVFGRRDNANLPMNEEVVYRSKEITPEQSSLLERPNSAQYTTAQELLNGDKVSASSGEMQVSSDKSSTVKRSKWVDEEDQERFAELKRLMLAKLGGQVNFGVDPEIFMLGVEMSYLVIKHGARQFVPYAKVMLEELGEAVRPYLRVIYSGTRYFDGMEPYRDEMTPSDELDKIDVSAIGKEPTMMEIIDTAAKEQEAKQQIGDVEQKVKAMKPKTPSRRKKDSPVQGDLFGDAAAGQNQSEQHQAEQAAPSHQFFVKYVGDALQLRRYTVMPNGMPIEDTRPVASAKSERDMLDIINNPANRFGNELDNVRKDLTAAIEAKESSPKKTDVDKQGNPIDADGKLALERINSIDELTDEDFMNPTRNVELPKLPDNVDSALGADGRPVIIKKNIFERNRERHSELTTQESRDILKSALYNPDLYGQNQKSKRPYNWVLIQTKDKSGRNRLVLLEVNSNKDNVEIVHWYYLRDESLETMKRQAEREGGLILILPSEDSKEAGGLSSRTPSSSSADKVTESPENIQVKTEENSEEDVTLHQRTRVESAFSNEVAKRMRSALTSGEKPFRSIVDLRKLAAECGMNVDSEGRDDILIQELVEDALNLVDRDGFTPYRGAMRAFINGEEKLKLVLDLLSQMGVRVNDTEALGEEDMLYRMGDEETLEAVNERFNEELSNQINGTLEKGHIYQLGLPSDILMSTGIPALPIQMNASRLEEKAARYGHDFSLSDVKDLVKALQHPVAVFSYGNKEKAQNIIVEIQKDGKNFVVGLSLRPTINGRVLDINSIRNVFPKNNAEWLNWISQGKSLYLDKEKIQTLIDQQRTILADVDYLDLDSVAKIVENFENPSVDGEKVSDEEDLVFRIREEEAPRKTGIGYKVFVLKGGQLYPPMVANPNGAATPVGVWLDADAAPLAGESKTGRKQVKAGGKGTQGGSGKLAYRPGWHLGEIPYALQFNRVNPETGEKELFPKNFVWAEVEYAADVDYQEEAMSYGYNASGKFQHSLAGLPELPVNGSYKYRTNPNPETDPWVITGAMKVNRILTPSEVDEMVREAGREPQKRQEGAVSDAEIERLNESLFGDVMRDGDEAIDNETISFENDPISKLMGVSRYSTRQQKAYAHRERACMREQVKEMASAMGIEIDIVESGRELSGKRARAKGWYDRRSGRITVVLGNHGSVNDIMKTVLHEAVAHYGLRKLFGDRFDDFLDNVFANASVEVKERIIRLAGKHGWNMRTATIRTPTKC